VTYHNSTTSASQNPRVSFDTSGYYTVTLTVANATGRDSETKTNYIHACIPGLWTGVTSSDWNTASNWDNDAVPTATTPVIIPDDVPNWPEFTGNFVLGAQCDRLTFDSTTQMEITGNFTVNSGKILDMTDGGELSITGDWLNNGTFIPGNGTVEFSGNSAQNILSPGPDITAYSRSTFPVGITNLSGAGTGPTGDYGQGDYPIGFTFRYVGVDYTTIRISTNGWLSLNLTGNNGYSNALLFTTSLPNTSISAWWDDLADDGTSKVYYKTEGTAPDRVFTVEWYRVLTYFNATARFSFQVKLYETTNAIEFLYGTVEGGSHSTYESASIGIEDATGGTGHYIEATTGSSTTPVTTLTSTSNWPAVNYRFLPPVAILEFNNIVINNTGATVNVNVSLELNGNLTVMPGSAFTVPTGKTIIINGTTVD
jgi:hypothetical protein